MRGQTATLESGAEEWIARFNRAMTLRLGFSIIEIIVAIVMIGIMLAVALPKYNRVVEKSRQAEAFTNLAAIRGAQMRYHAETGNWASGWDDEGFDAEEPIDPERYFTYEIVSGSGASITVGSAIRNANKNCCFGAYTAYVVSSGRITKSPAGSPYDSPP